MARAISARAPISRLSAAACPAAGNGKKHGDPPLASRRCLACPSAHGDSRRLRSGEKREPAQSVDRRTDCRASKSAPRGRPSRRQGAKLKPSQQPVRLMVENANSNGVRPLSYTFEVASDSAFQNKVFARSNVTPGTNGKTTITLDPLAVGQGLSLASPGRGWRQHRPLHDRRLRGAAPARARRAGSPLAGRST